jgi:outer membrane protein TolC
MEAFGLERLLEMCVPADPRSSASDNIAMLHFPPTSASWWITAWLAVVVNGAVAFGQSSGPLFAPPPASPPRPAERISNPPVAEPPAQGRLPRVDGAHDEPASSSDSASNRSVLPQVALPPPAASLWWEPEVVRPLEDRPTTLAVDVGSLMQLAMRCSQQVKAVEVTRWIRNEQTQIADAQFDSELYADSRFDDTSDPVGNSLVTGGPPRLNEHLARFEAGLRRKTYSGASISLSQRLGHDNSNSLFFIPEDQGNARMSLELRQPLLEGRGRRYNQSFVVETVFETEQAEAEYFKALQDRLFDVGAAYWVLYRARAMLAQQRRHVGRAAGIAEELQERQVFDALRSQVLRAQAAVATRGSELAVAEAEVRNAEAKIRALVNAPCLQCAPMPELLPAQPPPNHEFSTSVASDISQALCRRPEMRVLAAELRAANVRTLQAANETLPTLDLVLESYVSGLEGDSRVGQAWRQQFSQGAPSYGVGLQFSTPLGNRTAQSRFRQRQFDQTRIHHLMNDQSDRIRSEVEIAARDVEASFRTMQARQLSLEAVNAEMKYLQERWNRLRGDANLGQLQLDDLLNAQVRLFEEEKALATAQTAYGTALLALQRATGGLLIAAPQMDTVPPLRYAN